MFYVKEDDMDDLLRRAAENYKVDAEKAYDWEAIQASLEEAAPVRAVVQPKRKRRFIFWWLLLIPAGWLASNEWNKFQAAQKATSAVEQPSNTRKEKSSVPYETPQKDQVQVAPRQDNSAGLNKGQKTSNRNINKVAGNNFKVDGNALVEAVPATPKPNTVIDEQTAQNNSTQIKEQQDKNVVNNNADISSNNLLPRQNPPLPDLLNTHDTKTKETVNKTNNVSTSKKIEKTGNHYFYAGLAAGPDISFVKFQQTEAIGINAGVIGGYRFNKLSIETGIIYAEKNYYTKGEYFDQSKIPYFNNAEILEVSGYCHMFEIPLNVRYHFGEKKKHAWFASAGFSSYLMNKEYYDFDYIRNDTAHQGGYPYYNASRNWFSILNMSAGYELKTGDKTNLRIEPYYKLPVTGVGMGKISLSSVGVNVGITRRIP